MVGAVVGGGVSVGVSGLLGDGDVGVHAAQNAAFGCVMSSVFGPLRVGASAESWLARAGVRGGIGFGEGFVGTGVHDGLFGDGFDLPVLE